MRFPIAATLPLIASCLLQAKDNWSLRPVDGTPGGWSEQWKRLVDDPKVPPKRDLASLFVEPAFDGAWLMRIKLLDANSAMVFLASFPNPSEEASRIERKSKPLPLALASEIGSLWVGKLLLARYPEGGGFDPFDGVHCVAGGTTPERSYYLMGQIVLLDADDSNWMLRIANQLRRFVAAKEEKDERAELTRLEQMVREIRKAGEGGATPLRDKATAR